MLEDEYQDDDQIRLIANEVHAQAMALIENVRTKVTDIFEGRLEKLETQNAQLRMELNLLKEERSQRDVSSHIRTD